MRLATIDIGSNSIHMVIAEVGDDGSIEVLDREREMVKLGAGVFCTGRLSQRAVRDGLGCMERFVDLAEAQQAEEIVAVATSATREAENGGAFLDAIRRRTGISPRLISGREEARLIHTAVRHALPLDDEPAVIVDIGGGSTEIIVSEGGEIVAAESLLLGVQRLLDRAGDACALGKKQRQKLEAEIARRSQRIVEIARERGATRVIGTSGTLKALGRAAHRRAGHDPWRSINAEEVATGDLAALTDELCRRDPDERQKLPEIDERRADAVHLGALVITSVLERVGAEALTLCDASLRDGVLLDAAQRRGEELDDVAWSPRQRSVRRLARHYHTDTARAEHVAGLALGLFDGLAELHRLGDWERELLEAAALLHAIGRYVHFKSHHKHARYLVRSSSLHGYTDDEVELIALIVRYQRKARPKKKHADYRALSAANQRRVRILGALLRLAVGLDRRHIGAVRDVACEIDGSQVQVVAWGVADDSPELSAASRRAPHLADALEHEIAIAAAL